MCTCFWGGVCIFLYMWSVNAIETTIHLGGGGSLREGYILVSTFFQTSCEDTLQIGWGCSSVSRASDWHTADAGSIPLNGKFFSLPESASSADSRMVSALPHYPWATAITYIDICAHVQDPVVHVRVWWIMETETSSMHHRLGSATLSHLPFPKESNLNLPWNKSQWNNTVVKIKF